MPAQTYVVSRLNVEQPFYVARFRELLAPEYLEPPRRPITVEMDAEESDDGKVIELENLGDFDDGGQYAVRVRFDSRDVRQLARTINLQAEFGAVGTIYTLGVRICIAVGICYWDPDAGAEGSFTWASLAHLSGGIPDTVANWDEMVANMPVANNRFAVVAAGYENHVCLNAVYERLESLQIPDQNVTLYVANRYFNFGIQSGGYWGEIAYDGDLVDVD